MASDSWQTKIDGYLDGALSEAEMREMEAHLSECPACASEALRRLQLKNGTKLAGQRYTPSPEFRRKIAGQIAAKKPGRWRWLWTPALAMAVVALAVVALLLNRSFEQAQTRQLLSELTDLHVANMAAANPVDVVSSDRHTVKPWFQGRVPFSFNLPELAGTPFTLTGGRLAYFDHEPGAHLIYNVGAHHVSVFIFRDQPDLARAFAARESTRENVNFHVDSWSSQELRYFVVGDTAEDSIHQLSTMFRKAE